jgi:HK97 gp10 family phage protein
MADKVICVCRGFKELGETLTTFGAKIAKSGLRKATFQGAAVVYEVMKTAAPVRTGNLRDSIATFRRIERNALGKVRYAIGFRHLARKYAKNAKNRRLRRAGKTYFVAGPAFYAKYIELGKSGYAPHPFMRPALDSSRKTAETAIRIGLLDVIQRLANIENRKRSK